ncbi:MAG: GAF domain-containing protein [Candidatus Binatia bacterium]
MFKLLRYFSIAGFISTVIVAALLAIFYRQLAVKDLVRLKESENIALTQSFANSLWPHSVPLVATARGLRDDELRTHPEIAKLRQAVVAMMKGLPVVKVKVYDLTGLTVFSTEARQIGEDKSKNAGFLLARSGDVASELTHRDTFSAFEQTIENRDIISTYIPIRLGLTDPVEAVFEVYSDVTPFLQDMRRSQAMVVITVTVILTVLYFVLFFIVRHADKIIKRQHIEASRYLEETKRANEMLGERIEERTCNLSKANERLEAEIAGRKRMEETLQACYNELATLHQVGQTILSSPDHKTTLQEILKKTLLITSLDLGVIRLLDTRGETLQPVVSWGYQDPENVRMHRKVARDATSGQFVLREMLHKEPRVEENVQQCNGLRTLKREGVQSAIIVPVLAKEEVLGVIQLGSRTPRKFQPNEVRLLETLGSQMGIAVQKARLYEETQQRNRELQALYSITNAVTRSLDIESLMERALRTTIDVLGVDAGRLYVLDEKDHALRLAAHHGLPLDRLSDIERYAPGEGIVGRTFKESRPMVFADMATDSNYMTMARSGKVRELGFRSAAGFPITLKDQPVGVIYVYGRTVREFTSQDLDLLSAIGGQIGFAIENARLLEDLREKTQELEGANLRLNRLLEEQNSLREILNQINIMDMGKLLEKVAGQALKLLRVDNVLIRLLGPDGLLRTVASAGSEGSRYQERAHRSTYGRSSWIVENCRPLVIRDITQDKLFGPGHIMKEEGVKSYLGLPLISREQKAIGVLAAHSRTERDFTEEEIALAKQFASGAATAIENARFYEEIKNQAQELENVNNLLARQAAELARSNAELEQFAYVASHDLQEPLRMVASYTQLLAKRYKGKLDADADEFITYAVDGATRMQGLVKDLLAYSRVGTRGKDFEPTDCSAILNKALTNLKAAIEQSDAVVTHDSLPTVMADGTQLAQLFQNLISNAVKFRNQDPPLIHVSTQRNGKEWVFSLRDNGIGIDPQYAERIFVIFQCLHSKREYPGDGIGLAICKKIVERHGGRIWVESQPGQGATFLFTISDI